MAFSFLPAFPPAFLRAAKLSTILALSLLSGCLGLPEGISPVSNFALQPYLGTWYEIARLDHRFERGLSNVSARYAMREDGGVQVVNRGYDSEDARWREAEGRAYFVRDPSTGYLKVSFFGPFYGSYVVFEKDASSAQYAFVSGPNRSYLWLLARQRTVDEQIKARFVARSGELGFDTESLIWVEHSDPVPASSGR